MGQIIIFFYRKGELMTETYGFIEEWLAKFLELDFLNYPLDSGANIAAVDNVGFAKAERIVLELWEELEDSDPLLHPCISTSVIEGMHILVHTFWVNDDIFDEITSETAKELPVYYSIKALGTSGIRFNLEAIKNKIVESLNSTNKEQNDSQTEAVPADDVVEIKNEKKEIPKLTQREEKINNFFDTLKDISTSTIKDETCDGHRIVEIGINIPETLVNAFKGLATSINKHIVLIGCQATADYITKKKMKDTYDLKFIQSHTVILVMGSLSSNFDNCAQRSTICFGHNIKNMYILHSKGDDNSAITKIRNNSELSSTAKEDKISKIIHSKKNTPLYRYDAVYKDTVTNVIWAVKDRCVIHLLVDIKDKYEAFYNTALLELARRFHNKLPYDALREIDNTYIEEMNDGNKADYISFSLVNSRIILDELKKKRDEHYKMYKDFHTKALEHAKIYQKFADQISYFDENKFVSDEKKKAEENYDHTLDLDQVSAIIIKDNAVCVYTHNIYIQDERTSRWHDIGTFLIEISMHSNSYDTSKTVRIHNTKYQIDAFTGKMQAPHVYEDGHICHGNLATGMIDAYSRRDMFGLVYQILLFVSSANTSDGAGQNVDKWPEVTEDIALGNTQGSDEEKNEKMRQLKEAEAVFDNQLADSIPIHT